MKFKKIISALLASSFAALSAVSVSALELSNGAEVSMDDVIVKELQEELYSRGLSEQNIATLGNLGFHLDEMVQLSDSELASIFGSSRGRAVMPRITTYTVTGIPDELYSSTSDFVPGSGMVSGDFYDDNDGMYIQDQVDTFSNNAMPDATSYSNMYYLFGEYDPSIGVHQGVDIQPSPRNCTVYSQHEGTVVRTGGTWGAVGIYDSSANRTFYYLHMKNIQPALNSSVSLDDVLGTSSNKGVSATHFHFEVRKGKSTSIGNGNGTQLTSVYPYDYMA